MSIANEIQKDRKKSLKRNEIFISYNVKEDRILAKTVKDKLTILGKNQININFCELIPGGKDWRDWIWEKIHQSSIFIFLYTRRELDWNWCIHEAGIFRGSNEKNEGHLICIKNSKVSEYLAPIKDLQPYSSDEESIKKFLTDLFHDGKFTNGEPLNEDIFTEYEDAFTSAYKDIAEQFSATPISVDYLPRRLTIGPIEKNEDGTQKLKETPIIGNEETMNLFGLDDNEHVWGDLYHIYHNETRGSWVDDILLAIKMINKKYKPRRLLHNFRSRDKIRFYPVLSRIDRIDNFPIYLHVIFIGERDVEDQQDLKKSISKEPEPHKFLISLIELARSFRWDIIEWSLSELDEPNNQQHNKELVFDTLEKALAEIEDTGEMKGMRLFEVVKFYFPIEYHEKIEKCYKNYWSQKIELLGAIKKRDISSIIKLLEQWRAINKEFLLIAVNRYLELIKQLKPLD